jgi:hypothetical protein
VARKAAINGAIALVNERFGIDLRDRLKVSPAELVQGGYPKLQKVVGRLISEKVASKFREEVDPEVVRWVDAATSAPIGLIEASPGASSWVRTLPTAPECTLMSSTLPSVRGSCCPSRSPALCAPIAPLLR